MLIIAIPYTRLLTTFGSVLQKSNIYYYYAQPAEKFIDTSLNKQMIPG